MDAGEWRAAKGVLAEALACPPAEREAIVNARCADPGLRREIQAYLNEYDEHFLESVLSVSDTIDSTNGSGDAEQLPDIKNGDRIGPYVVLDRLGAGGMGQVFLGNDTRLQRKVALKCLSASASAVDLRARILHEARAAARITHPNIAIVHDVVEHEDRPFLVMEYVEGENLAARIKRERPPVETILTFLRQLASALAAAHGKGIVHRDLKPANIQVTPEGSVKILDFGVAHAMSAAAMGSAASTTGAGASLTVTMTTTTLQGDRRVMHPGTPAYMSPEQMFGRPIDQRSDIYSLGVIVYEMATGHRPYSTDDPLEVVLTLSKNFLTTGDSATNLPAQLNGVVNRMLAVKPDDRYQTAGELENALITLTALPAATLEQPKSRLRVAARVAATAAVAIAVVVLLGAFEAQAFNITLGRVAPFGREPMTAWLEYGFRSLVQPGVIIIALLLAAAGFRFLVRVLSLSRGIERLVTTGMSRTEALGSRLGLDNPVVLGQAVICVGVVLLAAIVWEFYPFLLAVASSISTQPAERFVPLQPGRPRLMAQMYGVALSVLLFVLGVGIARIQRLRTMQSIRQGGVALAASVTLALVAALMCVWPYRLIYQNKMPRVDVAGERCYAIGESGDDRLIFCPDRTPPRNRIFKRNDTTARDLGLVENIFTPPETSP